MPFKKLNPHLKEVLASLEITTPTAFQKASIPVIKSGANVYCTSEKGNGKTTTLILTTLQKLKCEAAGVAPRAIILVEDNESALQLCDTFETYTKHTSLRVYVGDERQHIDLLKSEIFEGVDILICAPKILYKLFLLEGLNTTQLKLFTIEDAEFLTKKASTKELMALTQSIQKCQFVVYSEKMHPTLKRFESYFMQHSKTVAV